MWFLEDGKEKPFDSEHPQQQSCSGFVCFNEKGEVLFGRNFDGAGGPLCMVFNSANGYRYIQFTAPNYNSAIYNSDVIGDCGYQRIDLNMGCPHPPQTGRGRGAGLYVRPDAVKEMMAEIARIQDMKFKFRKFPIAVIKGQTRRNPNYSGTKNLF